MFYCPDCCKFRPTDRCTLCGTRLLRAPAPGDICFLEEVEYHWSGMLEDVLKQNQILFWSKTDRPAALSAQWGHMFQTVRYYVAFEDLPRARDLADGLFHMPEETPFCD